MKLRALCAGIALGMAGSYAAAACDHPPLAQVPTPDEAENLEGQIQDIQSAVQEYHAAMTEYTACLQDEVEQARADDAPELVQTLLVQRNNAAVAEVEAVVTQFNQLVETAQAGSEIEQ